MRLDHLRYFIEAARCGSISAAARNVRLAQPAFSAHIRMLEQELGLTLLERSTKGVTLTEAGARLYEGALSLFRHVDQVREETVNAQASLTGEVRVVLAASAAPLLAGQLYWAVRQAHPQIRLVILDLLRVESDTLVTSRQVDFGLLPNVSTLVGAASEPVLAQDLYLVGRTRPPGAGEVIAFSDLQNLPLVMGGRKNQLPAECGGGTGFAVGVPQHRAERACLYGGALFRLCHGDRGGASGGLAHCRSGDRADLVLCLA